MTIAVIDYEMGNLRSVQKALERVGAAAVVTRDPEVIMGASAAVLPGVGAFGTCMENLRRYGLIEPVKVFIASGRPFLGICLGMQLLFDESEEFGPVRGLGLLPGKVVRFAPDPTGKRKVPQMGWNALTIKKRAPHLAGLRDGAQVYFVHSYTAWPERESVRVADCDYEGTRISAVVQLRNMHGCQFHPERSARAGARLLENALAWSRSA